MTRSKDLILQELARADASLAKLEQRRDELRARIDLLRSELAAAFTPATPPHRPSTAVDRYVCDRRLLRYSGGLDPTQRTGELSEYLLVAR